MNHKILFSNIGYARGIDGSLKSHLALFHRNFYADTSVQREVLGQLKTIIAEEDPDLCCFVEIDQGSFSSSRMNQIHELLDEDYRYHDIAGKYGSDNIVNRLPLHAGKSNAFISRHPVDFERLYFQHGTKRLVYHVELADDLSLLFAHFSLSRQVRIKQFDEIRDIVNRLDRHAVLLADFNIFQGFSELSPLLDSGLHVLNEESEYTFSFHRRQHTLDLCLCTDGIAPYTQVKVIPQPFSDHAALLVNVRTG